MNPQVSVIIPIFNAEKYLERCLNSILNQKFMNIEVILIDDGSTDKSGVICDFFKKKDKRFKVIHKNNEGAASARNYGLKIAKGEYIAFVDADDCISEYMFKIMYDTINKYNCDIVECNYSTDISKLYHNATVDKIEVEKNKILKKYFEIGLVAPWSKLIRKEILHEFKFENGKICEDILGSYEIMKKCSLFAWINYPLYYYNQECESVSRSCLSKKDFYCIEATLQVANDCKNECLDAYNLAILHYYRAIYNIIKTAISYGFNDDDTKIYYKEHLKEYKKILKKNSKKIYSSSYFKNSDKIQIKTLNISYNIYKFFKKCAIICKKWRKI